MRRALVLSIVLLFARAAGATVVIPAEFREIVGGSAIIVRARVVDVRPEWVDGRRQIETVVTAEVLESLKGEPGASIQFRIAGGEIGIYRSITVGAPIFRRGDEAWLFLRTDAAGAARVFGLNQGVFRVRQDPTTGRTVVIPPPVMAAGTAPERVRRGSASRRPLEVAAFGAQVRSVLAQQGGAR